MTPKSLGQQVVSPFDSQGGKVADPCHSESPANTETPPTGSSDDSEANPEPEKKVGLASWILGAVLKGFDAAMSPVRGFAGRGGPTAVISAPVVQKVSRSTVAQLECPVAVVVNEEFKLTVRYPNFPDSTGLQVGGF